MYGISTARGNARETSSRQCGSAKSLLKQTLTGPTCILNPFQGDLSHSLCGPHCFLEVQTYPVQGGGDGGCLRLYSLTLLEASPVAGRSSFRNPAEPHHAVL